MGSGPPHQPIRGGLRGELREFRGEFRVAPRSGFHLICVRLALSEGWLVSFTPYEKATKRKRGPPHGREESATVR
jgi:hypothetical protein